MKHFAKVKDGLIVQIISLDDENCNSLDFPASEIVGTDFIQSLGLEGDWYETSIDGAFRQRYAWIGGSYNVEFDCFVNPQPYPSWVMNSIGEWNSPVPYPNDAGQHDVYTWNEELLEWQFQFHAE